MDADQEVQIADYFETQTITKDSGSYYKLRDWIRQEIQSAILAEREACAAICDSKGKNPHDYTDGFLGAGDAYADLIRARSSAPEIEKEITIQMPPKSRQAGVFVPDPAQTIDPKENIAPDPISA